MKVKIIFKEGSEYSIKGTESFGGVIEVHHNYENGGRVAVECSHTGHTYPIQEIKEIIITK